MDIEDPSILRRYLAAHGYEVMDSRVLPGGVSNRTVLVRLSGGSSMVVKQARERLKSQSDWRSDPRRIRQEALAMEWLARWTPQGSIPRLLFLDESNHVLGMEAVAQPHAEWKSLLLSGDIDQECFRKFGELLAAIHRSSHAESRAVEPVFRDQSFFFSLRLEAYYLFTASRVPGAASFLLGLVEDCQERRFTLVHGDFSPKNVLVRGGELVLLDHEAAHFGNPAFDVGFAMTHFLSKALHLRDYRDEMRKGAHLFWRTYRRALPAAPEFAGHSERCVRHTLGCSLARVAGKSLLEYLTREERETQRHKVLDLMNHLPPDMEELIERFTGHSGR